MSRKKITYIISDVDKALAFEWIADRINHDHIELSFIFVLQQPAALATYIQKKGLPVFCFYYSSKKDLVKVLWKVWGCLRKRRPDVVHCHLLYGSLLGLTAARLAGTRERIYTRHHSDYHHRYFPNGIKWDRWCNRLATHIVAPSQAVKHILVKLENVPEHKITIINHGFDLGYFSEVPQQKVNALKAKYATHGHYPVVGVISRFTELKGIQYIVPAFQQFLANRPDALLMLFNAHGDYETTIRSLLENVPERNYRLVRFENELAAVYRLFDIFVQASTDKTIESFGQTYVEALAAGVPAIFTLSGIASDFVEDRSNALVVPFKDTEAICEALIELTSDNELRNTLKKNGPLSVHSLFNIDLMIKKLENLYGIA